MAGPVRFPALSGFDLEEAAKPQLPPAGFRVHGASMPTAVHAPKPAVFAGRSEFLHAIAVGSLGLEALPLSVLLWYAVSSGSRLSLAAPSIRGTLLAAAAVTAITVLLGVLAVDDPSRRGRPAAGWHWPAFVGLLLLPTAVSAAVLASPLTGGGLHVRLWALVLLGIADGQMAAAACLRQAAEAIPASRYRMATLDCISPWQRLRHVILPASVPALPLLAALTFVGTWSEFLLVAALRRTPGRFALGAAAGPENFVTAEYVFASLPLIFLGLWTLRACGRALTASFARNEVA